jgi:hypothetical protein
VSDFEGFTGAQDEKIISEAERKGLSREEAIIAGQEAARLECIELTRRRPDIYTPARVKERIKKAGEYAAWEYDGRMAGTIGRIDRGVKASDPPVSSAS